MFWVKYIQPCDEEISYIFEEKPSSWNPAETFFRKQWDLEEAFLQGEDAANSTFDIFK